jgi:hypothetical protein
MALKKIEFKFRGKNRMIDLTRFGWDVTFDMAVRHHGTVIHDDAVYYNQPATYRSTEIHDGYAIFNSHAVYYGYVGLHDYEEHYGLEDHQGQEEHSGLEHHSGREMHTGATLHTQLSTHLPLYIRGLNPVADNIGDRRINLVGDDVRFEKCVAPSGTKGGGSWQFDGFITADQLSAALKNLINEKLDKVHSTGTNRAYVVDDNNVQTTIRIDKSIQADSIVRRDASGRINAAGGMESSHVATVGQLAEHDALTKRYQHSIYYSGGYTDQWGSLTIINSSPTPLDTVQKLASWLNNNGYSGSPATHPYVGAEGASLGANMQNVLYGIRGTNSTTLQLVGIVNRNNLTEGTVTDNVREL